MEMKIIWARRSVGYERRDGIGKPGEDAVLLDDGRVEVIHPRSKVFANL
jgi:hypothetical protein